MVMKAPPWIQAVRAVANDEHSKRVLLSPQGRRLTDSVVRQLATADERLILLCGRYEGIDERVRTAGRFLVSWGSRNASNRIASGTDCSTTPTTRVPRWSRESRSPMSWCQVITARFELGEGVRRYGLPWKKDRICLPMQRSPRSSSGGLPRSRGKARGPLLARGTLSHRPRTKIIRSHLENR